MASSAELFHIVTFPQERHVADLAVLCWPWIDGLLQEASHINHSVIGPAQVNPRLPSHSPQQDTGSQTVSPPIS